MRNRVAVSGMSFLLVLALGTHWPALAGTYNWTFQEAGPAGGQTAALAMKTNSTWPMVFGQNPTYGSMAAAYSLKPVGWVSTTLGAGPGNAGIRAGAAPDGQVAAVWSTGPTIEFAASSSSGWLRKSFTRYQNYDTPNIAFLSNSKPVLAYSENGRMTLRTYSGTAWNSAQVEQLYDAATGQTLNPEARRVSVAVESQDNVCLAYAYNNQVGFAYQDFVTGNWYGKLISPSPSWGTVSDVSLAFGLNDQVGLAFRTEDRRLYYSSYDPRTGAWAVDQVASDVESQRVSVVFDQLGNPAMAYVSQNLVRFTTKVGYGWAGYSLPTQSPYIPYGNSDAALAFDGDNLPVIAYNSTTGMMVLAYDPIAVPEPASVLMIVGGLLFAARRWRVV